MHVKQISVFLENKAGSLVSFTSVLNENNIDLLAISLADTTDFGIIRAIVDKTDLAVEKLRAAGFSVTITGVLAVAVSDSPGGLSGALELMRAHSIQIEYLYSLVRRIQGNAVVIFRVDEPDKAAEMFQSAQIKLVDQEALLAEA